MVVANLLMLLVVTKIPKVSHILFSRDQFLIRLMSTLLNAQGTVRSPWCNRKAHKFRVYYWQTFSSDKKVEYA